MSSVLGDLAFFVFLFLVAFFVGPIVRTMARAIRAFLLGVWEFRMSSTTNPGEDLIAAYDWGREIAHRVTGRRYEP